MLLRKKSKTFATSSKVPNLLIACLSSKELILSSGTDFIKSVFIGVGPIEFTVIEKFASSLANILVRVNIADLDDAYIDSPSRYSGVATL